jgi:PKD repeat protein
MKLLRPTLLFRVCILALLGAATAGAQTPLEASFEVTPAGPTVNELVTLTDTTKNPTNAKLEFAWDLDADDQFDDGTSMAMTHAFATPGEHRVSLRVRRVGTVTVTDVATRTILVKEAGNPTPTPTPTEIATPKTFDASESTDGNGAIVRYQSEAHHHLQGRGARGPQARGDR